MATGTSNLILSIFFGFLMLCAAAVIVGTILSMMGVIDLAVQISSEPVVHRQITRAQLFLILFLALLLAAISFFMLRRIYV
jgi:hypothetical protein